MPQLESPNVYPLNESIDLEQSLEAIEQRLAMEILEERLEMDCWVQCNNECLVTFLSP